MSIEEHIQKLECFKKSLETNRPFGLAVQSIHAIRSERIFTHGENTDGGRIGQYNDTTPIYVNPNKSPVKFAPQGKNDKVKKENRKTKYFGSYKQFKESIGRSTDTVNLFLFGNLKSNFENRSRGNPEATKISNNEYHVGLDAENSKKKEGLEDKYGSIFKHTQEEVRRFYEIANIELQNERKRC